MLEVLVCSLVTIFPDYLFRRYGQGKRIGSEITLFSVWYELRWGLTACVMLTITLITVVFYFHPSTNNVTSFFRTIPILPEKTGRVDEVFVSFSEDVAAGAPLFKLDSAQQDAELAAKNARVAEVEAAIVVAKTELDGAEGKITEATSSYLQARDELEAKTELRARNPSTVSTRDIEKLQNVVDGRQGAVAAAIANKQSVVAQISTLLPAQRATAQAERDLAQVEVDKTIVRAGVAGRVEQFTLRVGDLVSPLMRPAGLLIPEDAGLNTLVAGFAQIEADVIKPGMAVEVICMSKPFTIIPMVVTTVQSMIAAGQIKMSEQLVDAQQAVQPGTLTVFLEPLYEGEMDGVPRGSSCSAYAYTNNHDLLESGTVSGSEGLFLHMVDAVALVHALIIRINVVLFPVKALVLSGAH